MLLNIESTQLFFMDELVDSLLEMKTYKQLAVNKDANNDNQIDSDAIELPIFITYTDNWNL